MSEVQASMNRTPSSSCSSGDRASKLDFREDLMRRVTSEASVLTAWA